MKKIQFLFCALFCLFLAIGCSDFILGTVDYYTVVFNWQDGVNYVEKTVKQGESVILPVAARSGYEFNGWYSAANGGVKYGNGGDNYMIIETTTMYAQWEKLVVITFDSQGGTYCPPITQGKGSIITLPTPTRDGYTFNGWYSAAIGGIKYGEGDDNYKVIESMTMYAQWSQKPTITFDSQGGTGCLPITQGEGTTITLPVSTRDGYTFNGWYSAETDGDRYGGGGDNYTITETLTMYAQWEKQLIWDNNPIEITTEDELRELASKVNGGNSFSGKTIVLGNDIELKNGEWIPIGNNNRRFAGTFDGNHKNISGVYNSDYSQDDCQGIFGVSFGTIKNLGVRDVNIKGGSLVGGLVGLNVGKIENCFATGTVTGTGEKVGGLSGENSSTITDCFADVEVKGYFYYVGGLVGLNSNGTITNCYAIGNVIGTLDCAGGLVGLNGTSTTIGTITNCYATGNVTGTTIYTGGLVGYNGWNSSKRSIINDCYASGNVIGTTRKLAGDDYGTITGNTAMKSASDMKLRGTYSSNWNFSTIWGFDPNKNSGFPYLRALDWSY